MTRRLLPWAPVVVLAVGALFVVGIDTQRSMGLRTPLATAVSDTLLGFPGRDVVMSEAERRVAGVTDYLMRLYEDPTRPDSSWFSVYIGYYDRQLRGKTIHSPRNCLPGSGWSALRSETGTVGIGNESVNVNRYVVQNGSATALVLYWYQGRGRTQASEYLVKWNLLRDAALHGRTEEALVRVVVPITTSERAAEDLANTVAAQVAPGLFRALPAWTENNDSGRV